MAKFIFKMNSLLELKSKLEEQEKIFYGNARSKLTNEENKLKSLVEQKMNYENRSRMLMQSKLNIIELRNLEAAIKTKTEQMKLQKLEIAKAEKNLEAARIRLSSAVTERKTYEILKEKAFEQFKRELEAEEQKEVDELVSFVFNRPADYEEEY